MFIFFEDQYTTCRILNVTFKGFDSGMFTGVVESSTYTSKIKFFKDPRLQAVYICDLYIRSLWVYPVI